MPVGAVGRTCLLAGLLTSPLLAAAEPSEPEAVIRALVQANANKDLPSLANHIAQDADVVGYTIGGRKYIGWAAFAAEMQQEFTSVVRLEIPITELRVWTHGDVAWFAMELDYIRHIQGQSRTTRLPLRETGVLERRDGRWMLVAWHESSRTGSLTASFPEGLGQTFSQSVSVSATDTDVSGRWEIQEEDKSYTATLDKSGNGAYTHQGGRINTTMLASRKWQGTWHQTGNDREGGFELLLSEDGTEARGVWWYTRVGDRANIPPRQWGGSYVWKRLPAEGTTQ